MPDTLERMMISGDIPGLDDYAWHGDDIIIIDWREMDDYIVEYVAKLLPNEQLLCEWVDEGEDLLILFNGVHYPAGLTISPADRSVMLYMLNKIMEGKYEIRAFSCTIGAGETLTFIVKPSNWWYRMESQFPT